MSGLWSLIFKVVYAAERKRASKDPGASDAIIDSHSVKTTEEGAGSNGYDAHKRISRVASDTFWWTPGVFRSRFTLHPQTSTIA